MVKESAACFVEWARREEGEEGQLTALRNSNKQHHLHKTRIAVHTSKHNASMIYIATVAGK